MPSIQDAVSTFLKVDRSPHTIRFYTFVLTEMSEAIGMRRDIKRVRYEDLLDHIDLLKSRLKENSVRSYLNVIQSFFNWCVKRRYMRQSPAEDLWVRVERSNNNRAIPVAELKAMVEYARVTSKRDYALMLFMVDTGCRVGGLSRMTLDNLNIEQRTALLIEKGNKPHRVYFSEECAAALQAWLDQRPDVAHNYVWTGRAPHRPLTGGGISAMVRRLAVETGASQIWGPHAIRHAVGHAMAKAGLPASAVQEKLGHDSAATTIQYYFPHDEAYMRQIADRYPLIALREDKPILEMPRVVPRKEAQ